ncbi:MAG: hypothetical protein RL329_2991 [Bacteroidota bacterium]|jgi:hypothetical protein
MRNLRNLRSFFSNQEQLSKNQLQTICGGAIPMVTTNNQVTPNQTGQIQNGCVSAMDDNKRPERPGGGVSTH